MNPNEINNSETKKISARSTVFALACTVAVLFIAGIFWYNDLSGRKKPLVATLEDKLTEERQVLRTDMLLHQQFSRMQQLDEQYNRLLTENTSPGKLDSLEYLIMLEEAALSKRLDSVNNATVEVKAWANVVMLDSITASFRKALANRKYLASLRGSLKEMPLAMGAGQKEMLRLEYEIQKKEEKIIALEMQVRNQSKSPVQNMDVSGNQKKYEELEVMLQEEEVRNTGLLDLTNSLKKENEKLNGEVAQLRRSSQTGEASAKTLSNRNDMMQQQLNELNAELNFTRIDCNMSRANVEKIISNSRQRKELLAASLKSLQVLAGSENSNISLRAKEKIRELNQIASTVRD